MDLYEYMVLSNEEQWDELWDHGQFITHFESIDCKFALYALHKFFVEVELDPVKDTLIGKNIFKEGRCMDKYAGYLGFDMANDW